MGNCCEVQPTEIYTTVLTENTENSQETEISILRIQTAYRKHTAERSIKSKIANIISEFKAKCMYPNIEKSKISSIRWPKLEEIEKNFNQIYGKYTASEGLYGQKTLNKENIFVFSMQPVLYKSLIYDGQWKYDSIVNMFAPYGIGSIIKETGLKIESFFDDLKPVASISRIYYPNGRIYLGQLEMISSQYLPHGRGQMHQTSGYFEMTFDKGLPIGNFLYESFNKNYQVKGMFNNSIMNESVEINYSNGTTYSGPFDYDNIDFTVKKESNKTNLMKSKQTILTCGTLTPYLNYADLAILQQIQNRAIQNNIKNNRFKIWLNYYITNNIHLKSILDSYRSKISHETELIKNLNKSVFIPLSAYATNGGNADYETHYSNIFNPSPKKVFFSNFYYDRNRAQSNIFIKGAFNNIIHNEIQTGNEAEIASSYNKFFDNYIIDHNNSNIFDTAIFKSLSQTEKPTKLFSINQIVIKIDINPYLNTVLTNPVKAFALFITHDSFSKEPHTVQEFREEHFDQKDKWKKYIDDKGKINPINQIDNENCNIVEFNSLNDNGLFLFVEMKQYNMEITYSCKDKLSHIGKEVKIVLFDQNVAVPKAAKCGIDFGTILFKGNIIEMISG